MYPLSDRFHEIAIQQSPKTLLRVYFIDDTVDCTDDNDVRTNGTLLIGAAGSTDSNGRISMDSGVTFTEYFNPDKNVQIGTAVSSRVSMTLLNYDGALNSWTYGRCKIYLYVYDEDNTTWCVCPMGVYIIDEPAKHKTNLVSISGYDQMQKLDAIADTWWAGLNWAGGITLSQLITSLATQVGVSVSSTTASRILNSTVSFTEAPFSCVSVTYREVLEYIAEATGTVARFDRDGALDLKWFVIPTIGGDPVSLETDTTGNRCISVDIAEYSVARVDLLRAKFAEGDLGVTVGSGTNEYTIQNNLFLGGADATAIRSKLTPIYNRLHAFAPYNPISASFVRYDWSLEAGDVIYIQNNSTSYKFPIFQQTMVWRGGSVSVDLLSDGDAKRPMLDASTRDYYRLDSEMRTITIEADRINLLGYTTINNGFRVNLDGTFEANGATINGSFVSKGQDANGADINTELSNGTLTVKRTRNGTTTEIGKLEYTTDDDPDGYDERLLLKASYFGDNRSLLLSPASQNGIILSENGTWLIHLNESDAIFDVPVQANSDLDVGGVLTVTNRIAEATLSSAGWYRVLTFAGTDQYDPLGLTGALMRFNIERYGNTGSNGNHQIDLSWAYNHREFVNELSNGADVLVDKIRATTKGNEFYVDIHFAGTSVHRITVDFDVKSFRRGLFTTNGLDAVDDAPDGETVVTTYTFSQTGAHFGDVFSNGLQLFGLLSGGTAITSNADLNNYTTPGVYTCTYAVATTLTNSNITTVGFKMLVMDNGADNPERWQLCFANFSNCIIAVRWRDSSRVWRPWKRITPA